MTELALVILLQDVLIVMLVAHVCLVLRQPSQPIAKAPAVSWLPIVALIWGALWSYVPVMQNMRLSPPPLGQAAAILASVVVLCGFWLGPTVRTLHPDTDYRPLLGLAVWRLVFGMSILAVGVGGGLPSSFYWSVGLGDLAVGLFGAALILRTTGVSRRLFLIWNVVGMIDLIHVLVLGAITLIPFFAAKPDLPLTNLLPLTGVPLLLSLHFLGLRRA